MPDSAKPAVSGGTTTSSHLDLGALCDNLVGGAAALVIQRTLGDVRNEARVSRTKVDPTWNGLPDSHPVVECSIPDFDATVPPTGPQTVTVYILDSEHRKSVSKQTAPASP